MIESATGLASKAGNVVEIARIVYVTVRIVGVIVMIAREIEIAMTVFVSVSVVGTVNVIENVIVVGIGIGIGMTDDVNATITDRTETLTVKRMAREMSPGMVQEDVAGLNHWRKNLLPLNPR